MAISTPCSTRPRFRVMAREASAIRRRCVVVMGIMGQVPFAGVGWQVLHYLEGFRRLEQFTRSIETGCEPEADFDAVIAHEHQISTSLDGRIVFDDQKKSSTKSGASISATRISAGRSTATWQTSRSSSPR